MFNLISNHEEQALARLITQYQSATNLKNLIGALVGPIQGIENALYGMNTDRYLYTAVGVQLDNIGRIVGFERPPGLSDSIYRQDLIAQIKINVAQGEPEELIDIFRLFTGAQHVILIEQALGSVIIQSEVDFPDQATVDALMDRLTEILPLGVRIDSIDVFDPDNAFSMDGTYPGSGGFGDEANPAVGGLFAKEWVHS